MVALFVPKEHNGSAVSNWETDRWDKQWIDQFHGRATSLQERTPFMFHCSHLVHFTENEDAEAIGNGENEFTFKPKGWKPENEHAEEINYLSWWASVPPEAWEKNVRNCIPDMLETYDGILGSSPSFNGESLCGRIGFVISFKEILDEYAKSRECSRDEVELRIFGTSGYCAEIMYNSFFGDEIKYKSKYMGEIEFNVQKNGTEAFHRTDDVHFIWKVYSTIGFDNGIRKANAKKTWDHLSFALYFPKKDDILKIRPKLCKIDTKKATQEYPRSREKSKYEKRGESEMWANAKIMHELRKKIQKDKLFSPASVTAPSADPHADQVDYLLDYLPVDSMNLD